MLHIILHQGNHSTKEDAEVLGPLMRRAQLYSPEMICPTEAQASNFKAQYKLLRGPQGNQWLIEYIAQVRAHAATLRNPMREGLFADYDIEEHRQFLQCPKPPHFTIAEECSPEESAKIQKLWEARNPHGDKALESWIARHYPSAQKAYNMGIAVFKRANDLREGLIEKKAAKLATLRANSEATWLLLMGSHHNTLGDRILRAVGPELVRVETTNLYPHDPQWQNAFSRSELGVFEHNRPIPQPTLDALMIEGVAQRYQEGFGTDIEFATALRIGAIAPAQMVALAQAVIDAPTHETTKQVLVDAGILPTREEAKLIFEENYGHKRLLVDEQRLLKVVEA